MLELFVFPSSQWTFYYVSDPSIKESNKNRAPAFTFGSRHEKKLVSNSPAPNVYNTSRLNPRGKPPDESQFFAISTRVPSK